ncbi:unnamed protein product [Effrenium voratum]|nr:unnamed protein product [Effrenium voratum]
MLTELFFNFTEVQVKPSLLLDLFEDSQGSRHSRGISTAEFLVAVGSMAATEGIPVDTSPEGRMSRAQMEARSQLGPFEDYALELRSAVRQKVKVPLVPKVVATGSILEPLSYVNPSCVLEAPPDREETEGEKLLEAMRKKMETLNLVKDEQLREALSAELCEKESAQLTLLREANHLPQLHQPGAAEFKAFYHHMEEYPKYVPDEELVERMRGYFYDAGGLVESQSVLLEKKQHPSGIKAKSLKLARL